MKFKDAAKILGMLNEKYPKASKLSSWALAKAPETMDAIEREGEIYQCFSKRYSCKLKKEVAPVYYEEIGNERVYLINTESHQIWIEAVRQPGSDYLDYGKMQIGEVRYERAQCCRCKVELYDLDSARFGACEDCMDTDPEVLMAEFARGEWG